MNSCCFGLVSSEILYIANEIWLLYQQTQTSPSALRSATSVLTGYQVQQSKYENFILTCRYFLRTNQGVKPLLPPSFHSILKASWIPQEYQVEVVTAAHRSDLNNLVSNSTRWSFNTRLADYSSYLSPEMTTETPRFINRASWSIGYVNNVSFS